MSGVRYGVVGVGGFGEIHVRSVLQNPRAELTALADVDVAAVQAQAEDLGVRAFTDHREMLDAGVVDAVSVVLPHHLHAPVTLDCLEAGVHVYVEKPIAVRVSEADAMIDAARHRGLKLCVGHQYRTFRSSRVLRHLMDRVALGRIHRVLWMHHTFYTASHRAKRPWRFAWKTSGGGVLAYRASHDLDLLCWLLGRPVQVSAMPGERLHDAEVYDAVCATVRFESGALACVETSVNEPAVHNVRQFMGDEGVISIPETRSLAYDHGELIRLGLYEEPLSSRVRTGEGPHDAPEIRWFEIEIPRTLHPSLAPTTAGGLRGRLARFLRGGSARHDDGGAGARRSTGEPLPFDLPELIESFDRLPRPKQHGTTFLISGFVDAIIGDGEAPVTGENALPALELVNGILLSAVRERTVDLPVDRDEIDDLFTELCDGASGAVKESRRA